MVIATHPQAHLANVTGRQLTSERWGTIMSNDLQAAPAPSEAPADSYLDRDWPILEATPEDYERGETIVDVQQDRELRLAGLEQADELGVLTSANAERMVQIAATQIGVVESGGENMGIPLTRYVRYFVPSSGPQPWCAYFASWCWDRATDANRVVPWSAGSTSSVYYWAQRVGRLVSTPQRGDFCLNANFMHMGIIERVVGTTLYTIDGNWSNGVRRVSRTRGTAYRYVRLP